MNLEFPYQLVAFLDTEPSLGEPVYYGENGWYPQIALKRRFKIKDITEEELVQKISEFIKMTSSFTIFTKDLVKPDTVPVKVLEVEPSPELMTLHADFIEVMGDTMISRYPERDGENYYPHITVEYDDKMVVDETLYDNKPIVIEKVFLLKDMYDQNSIAYKSFTLR